MPPLFNSLRQIYEQASKDWTIKNPKESLDATTGVRIQMKEDFDSPSRVRAIVKGGNPANNVEELQKFADTCQDFKDASFIVWMYKLFPNIMVTLDTQEAIIVSLMAQLEKVLQRPHNKEVRKDAYEFIRVLKTGEYMRMDDDKHMEDLQNMKEKGDGEKEEEE